MKQFIITTAIVAFAFTTNQLCAQDTPKKEEKKVHKERKVEKKEEKNGRKNQNKTGTEKKEKGTDQKVEAPKQ